MAQLKWVDVEALQRRKAELQREAQRIREELDMISEVERLQGPRRKAPPGAGPGRPPRRLQSVVEVLRQAGAWLSAEEIQEGLQAREPDWDGWKAPEASMRGLVERGEGLLVQTEEGRYGLAEWEGREADDSGEPDQQQPSELS